MDEPMADVARSQSQIGEDIFAPRPRLEWVDAAKGIGILLVVIAHVWTRGPVRDAIYIFHMPLFFLLSGYCARPLPIGAFARAQAVSVAVPYMAFLLTLTLADQLIEPMRDHLPVFRNWEQAARALLLGGSELKGPFTIFWFIPCLAIARLCQNMLWNLWPDPRDPRWVAAMAASLTLGLWLGARSDFSPLGLLTVPVALVLLWLGAMWRTVPDDRALVTGAALIGAAVLLFASPPALEMKTGDYGEPIVSIPLAIICSLAVAGIARLSDGWTPLRAVFTFLGRRSLVIMYGHVPVIHYCTPYFGKPVLLVLAVLFSLLLHEGLACTGWGQRYFLGRAPRAPKISYN